jgi:pilus assembly protein CpaB
MQNRAFTISFLAALLSVFMVYSYVSSTEEGYRLQYGQMRNVVVAKRNIKELDILDETNLTYKEMPAKLVEPGTSSSFNDFKGGLAVAPINQDEQITRTKVTQLGARTGLARQIQAGKRAMTIRVSDESGVAKLIKPGDRVDVVAIVDPTGSGNKLFLEARTVLQDVLVLATGKYVTNTVPGIIETDPFKPELKSPPIRLSEYMAFANITLEVEPLQAQVLFYTVQNSPYYLALRNNDDNVKEELSKTTIRDLMGRDGASFQAPTKQPASAGAAPAFPATLPGKH